MKVKRYYGTCQLPPLTLIKALDLEEAIINEGELSRAVWFWNRRPKLVCESLTLCYCYVAFWALLLYRVPDTISLLFAWMVIGASCAFVDRVRLNRWRNEYEASIKRLIVHHSERK